MKKAEILLLLLTLFGGAALLSPVIVAYWTDRPLRDPLQFFLFHDDTEYAHEYSESRFGEVKLGMSQQEVQDLLGGPVQILENCNGRIRRMIDFKERIGRVSFPDLPPYSDCPVTNTIYYYSRPGPSSDHWYVRAVSFTPNGIISGITRSFYAD